MKRNAITKFEGTVYTHRVLYRTANVFLDAAKASPIGSFYNGLAATLFAWLTFEAYLNCVIAHLDPEIFAKEQSFFSQQKYRGVLGKVRWILEQLNSRPNPSAERSRRLLVKLHRLRNHLAHAKPVRYSGAVTHSVEDDRPLMESKWVENQVTMAHAQRYIAAVENFCEWMHRNIPTPFADPHLRRYAFKGTTQSQTSTTSLALQKR